MVDPVSATALIIAVISGIGSLITQIHINKCKSSCCESDCTKTPKNTPPHSPHMTLSMKEKEESKMKHNFEEMLNKALEHKEVKESNA